MDKHVGEGVCEWFAQLRSYTSTSRRRVSSAVKGLGGFRLGSPVSFVSSMNDSEWSRGPLVRCRWFARFRCQNSNRKSIRGRKLAPFAETGFLVSARCGEGRGKGANEIEADSVGRGRKM